MLVGEIGQWPHQSAAKDELHLGLPVPNFAARKIHEWARQQPFPEGTELEHPKDYHVTLLYAPEGGRAHDGAGWLEHLEHGEVNTDGFDSSFGSSDGKYAYVLLVDSQEIKDHAEKLQQRGKWMGLDISEFKGGYKPHITVAYGPTPHVTGIKAPEFWFGIGPSEVSPRRAESSAPTEPPRYRPKDKPSEHCGNCKMLWRGKCWGYGNKKVDPEYVCNSWVAEKTVKEGGVATHYNRWTGLPCNCPWHHQTSHLRHASVHEAGQNINKVLKAPDKAYRTPEGEAFKQALPQIIPEEHESLAPYIAQRWKKGEIRLGDSGAGQALYHQAHAEHRYDLDPGWDTATNMPMHGVPRGHWSPLTALSQFSPGFLPQWHQWYEARQHPTRRGVNVMDPDFTVHHMQRKVEEHQQALAAELEQREAQQYGRTVHTFPADPGGIMDYEEAVRHYPHLENDIWHLNEGQGYQDPYHPPEAEDWEHEFGERHFPSDHDYEDQLAIHNQRMQDRRNELEAMHDRLREEFDSTPREAGWHIKHLNAQKNDADQNNDIYASMEHEGRMMGHCIGADDQPYKSCADQGLIDAYSLRDHKGQPHVTWHYNSDGSLAEMFGPNDDPIKPQYQKMLQQWGENSGHETDPDYAQGMMESAEVPEWHAEDPEDMEDYLTQYGDAGDGLWDMAHESGERIGEYTDVYPGEPQWPEIAQGMLGHRNQYQYTPGPNRGWSNVFDPSFLPTNDQIREMHQTTEDQGHNDALHQHLNDFDIEHPGQQEVVDYWNQLHHYQNFNHPTLPGFNPDGTFSSQAFANVLHRRFASHQDPVGIVEDTRHLLRSAGYPDDDITTQAMLQAWQQMYPLDKASTLAEPLEPHIQVYHGTTNRALERARQRGVLEPWHPRDVANEVASHYGLNPDEFYDHPYFEFSRDRGRDPNLYVTTNPEVAQHYADSRSEQLEDALNTAHRMLNPDMYNDAAVEGFSGTPDQYHRQILNRAKDEFRNQYHQTHDIQPQVVSINVPHSAIPDDQQAALQYEAQHGLSPETVTGGTYRIPGPIPLDWISPMRGTTSAVKSWQKGQWGYGLIHGDDLHVWPQEHGDPEKMANLLGVQPNATLLINPGGGYLIQGGRAGHDGTMDWIQHQHPELDLWPMPQLRPNVEDLGDDDPATFTSKTAWWTWNNPDRRPNPIDRAGEGDWTWIDEEEDSTVPSEVNNPEDNWSAFKSDDAKQHRNLVIDPDQAWNRTGMAADPAWIHQWIANHGPYLFHGAAPRFGEDPEQIAQKILTEGIRPDSREHTDWPAWTPEEERQGVRTDENYDALDPELDEAWLNPRPGHTYLTAEQSMAYGPPTFRVDLRQLDPANLNPDDDFMRDQGYPTHYKQTVPPKSLGQQAEEYDWGSNPQDTHDSMDSHGVVAHRGFIPPEAIERIA